MTQRSSLWAQHVVNTRSYNRRTHLDIGTVNANGSLDQLWLTMQVARKVAPRFVTPTVTPRDMTYGTPGIDAWVQTGGVNAIRRVSKHGFGTKPLDPVTEPLDVEIGKQIISQQRIGLGQMLGVQDAYRGLLERDQDYIPVELRIDNVYDQALRDMAVEAALEASARRAAYDTAHKAAEAAEAATAKLIAKLQGEQIKLLAEAAQRERDRKAQNQRDSRARKLASSVLVTGSATVFSMGGN